MSEKTPPAPRPRASHGPGPRGMGAIEKPKNFKKSLKSLLKELKIIRLSIILTVIFASIAVTTSIFSPKILGKALTEVAIFLQVNNTAVFLKIANYLIVVAVLYVTNYIFSLLAQVIIGRASAKVAYNLRKKLKHKLVKLPLSYFDKNETGNTLSVFINDVDNIANSLQQSINNIIFSLVTIIGVLIMMISINFWLTLIVVALLPVSVLLTRFVMKHSQKYFVRQANDLGSLNGHIEETYSNQKTVKSFAGEQKAIDEFVEKNEKLYESSQKSHFYAGLLMPLINFSNNLGYVVLRLVSCIFILNGLPLGGKGFGIFEFALEFGYITTFLTYSQQFTQPIVNIAQIINVLQTTLASSERVFEILELEELENFEVINKLEKIEGHIQFNNLTFGYTSDKILLNNINCNIPKGKMVAIVGPTGAGKTTLVNLIMRFYELNGGNITIDGIDIKTVSRENLREKIGMVLQDTWLFKGTIMENLKYGNPNITDEEVKEICKSVHAHHFITTLEHGYETIINEGATNISQGQKQLLTIARAIIAKPDIMILDEATSNIDTRTEVLIQKAMKLAMENRTSFVIAHRLSTIVNADIILVVNNGDIVEQGNHNTLMALKGFYYNLYNSQFA